MHRAHSTPVYVLLHANAVSAVTRLAFVAVHASSVRHSNTSVDASNVSRPGTSTTPSGIIAGVQNPSNGISTPRRHTAPFRGHGLHAPSPAPTKGPYTHACDGLRVGLNVGFDGLAVGATDGFAVGLLLGLLDGDADGAGDACDPYQLRGGGETGCHSAGLSTSGLGWLGLCAMLLVARRRQT